MVARRTAQREGEEASLIRVEPLARLFGPGNQPQNRFAPNGRKAWLIAVLGLAGCDSTPWYEDASLFQREAQSWALLGAGADDVVKQFETKGFACARAADDDRTRCYRQAVNFPCSQDQAVFLDVGVEGTTVTPVVLDNGELPTRCL